MSTSMDNAEKEFQKIYEDHYPRIVRYLRRLVGDSDAEDVAQEVFVKVHQALDGFRGEIYKLLPRTNCRECGQPTCMMFASLATEGAKGQQDCPRLSGPGLQALEAYLSKFSFS